MVKNSTSEKSGGSRRNYDVEKRKELRGVRMRKWGKWVSEVRIPNSGARIWLGSYRTPQQAARAFDCALYFLRGCNANFNFPECVPQIPHSYCLSLAPAEIQSLAAKFAMQQCPQPSEEGVAICGNGERHSSSSTESDQNLKEEGNCPLLDFLLEGSPEVDDFEFPVLSDKQGQVLVPEAAEYLWTNKVTSNSIDAENLARVF